MPPDSPFANSESPAEPTDDAAYMEALRQLYRGRVERARGMANAATSAAAAGSNAGSFTDLMAAAIVELITELPDFDDESIAWANRITTAALQARRPAWAAAARAVNACGLLNLGRREHAIREIAAAEVELTEEESWQRHCDPLGKPHGTGAAHNNLGCAMLLMRCYAEGAHHFERAAAISTTRYGPGLAEQVLFDLFNRAMLQLCWALDEESLGGADQAVELAKRGAELLTDFRDRIMDNGDESWGTAVLVIGVGLQTIISPGTISAAHLRQLESHAIGGGQVTYLSAPMLVVQARVARLIGEPQVAIGAAETAAWLMGDIDPFAADATQREAVWAAPERYPGFDPTRWAAQREADRKALHGLLAEAGCSPFDRT